MYAIRSYYAPTPPQGANACESLAYVFFLVAENRDRGRTREEQVEMMRASRNNFV